MNTSFWEHDSYFDSVDVVIVGAGIVGLSTSVILKQKNPLLKVLVLERGVLPNGASTKNAGFACFGSPTELLDDLDNSTEEEVVALVTKRWKGLTLLRSSLGDENIDYNNYGGYELFDKDDDFEKCMDNLGRINNLLLNVFGDREVFVNAKDRINYLGFKNVKHLLFNKFEGQIDTGKMMLSLQRKAIGAGVIVLNGIEVNSVSSEGNGRVCLFLENEMELYTRKVLIATNGFAKNLIAGLPVQPARSQILITSPVENNKLKGSFHFDKGFYYCRNVGNRILLGGGRNLDINNEFTDVFGLTDTIQERLEELLRSMILPGVEYHIERRWSGIMGLGPEKNTILKEVEPSVFCAVRMGGMGIAIGSLVAEEAAEIIANS